MEPADWKDFLLKYKWMSRARLHELYGIKKHDFDNFRRKPEVRAVLYPWRVSLKQPPERLREILGNAWEYYLTQVLPIDFDGSPRSWVPELLAVNNVGKAGFSFLTGSKYLNIVCPDTLENFREHGYTNVALAAYEFFPGSNVLRRNAVLPYMFQQTHRKALESTEAESMIEHVYLNFLAGVDGPMSSEQIRSAKERMYVRYREPGLVTGAELSRFGVPGNFYSKKSTLKAILEALHRKYGEELGYLDEADPTWSRAKFKRDFPQRSTDSCEYCELSPVDLHHLLPRKDYPHLTYDSENVVPLCVNVHQYITRGHWTAIEKIAYDKALKAGSSASNKMTLRDSFNGAMELIHSAVYGKSFLRGGQ